MIRKLNGFDASENLHSLAAQILWNLTHQVRPLLLRPGLQQTFAFRNRQEFDHANVSIQK